MTDQLILTTTTLIGKQQQIDVEIVDSSPRRNVYLSKRNITGETRLAVTSHAEGDVGVCFKNYLDAGESGPRENRTANR